MSSFLEPGWSVTILSAPEGFDSAKTIAGSQMFKDYFALMRQGHHNETKCEIQLLVPEVLMCSFKFAIDEWLRGCVKEAEQTLSADNQNRTAGMQRSYYNAICRIGGKLYWIYPLNNELTDMETEIYGMNVGKLLFSAQRLV